MPEGPEVRIIAESLFEEVVGWSLVAMEINSLSRYHRRPLDSHDRLQNTLPQTIIDLDTKGKKIIFALEGDIFLVSSLSMEGKWVWHPGKHSGVCLKLVNSTDGSEKTLYFDDSRHFGRLEIIFSPEELITRMNKIGPDLLKEDVSEEVWFSKLRGKRIQHRTIGWFLMKQKYFSGIGNYLRAEILYAVQISPHRQLGELSDEEAGAILAWAKYLITESYTAQGLTIASFRDPHGKKGSFEVKVYGKTCDPEGHPVITEKMGDRIVHWVPEVQK